MPETKIAPTEAKSREQHEALMNALVEHLSHQFDRAANMDW